MALRSATKSNIATNFMQVRVLLYYLDQLHLTEITLKIERREARANSHSSLSPALRRR